MADRSNAPEPRLPRPIDAVIAGLAAIVLSPVYLVVACLVRWRLGRPVLFRQERAGVGGRPFTMLKFRTMSVESGPDGSPLPDAERLGPLGRRLRTSSVDELPELWNVVRGEMALVGPRPLPVSYLDRYTADEARRHEVRPGLTGWAQVNGRNASGWEERLAMDVWYVDNRSLGLDAKILLRTVGAVLRRQGIAAEGHATMPELRPPARRDG